MRCFENGFLGLLFALLVLLAPSYSSAETPLLSKADPQLRWTAQDPQGHLHTVWVSQDGPTSSLLYEVTDLSGRSLTGSFVLTEGPARIRRPQLAIDGQHVIHLLWQERTFTPKQDRPADRGVTIIRYAKLSVKSTGTVTFLLHPVTLNHDPAATHPSLAVDPAGWAYAVWEIEGSAVRLTTIDPSSRVIQVRRITRQATKTDHALPAVAVDRRGNVHVVWSTESGDKTQLVYKTLRGHGGQVLEKEKIVYTANNRGGKQTKVVTFDPHGDVKISWVSSPSHYRTGQRTGQRMARLGGAPSDTGYLLLRPNHTATFSSLVAVVDRSLAAAPGPVWTAAGEAVVTPKQRLDAPAQPFHVMLPADVSAGRPSGGVDQTISKLLMERLLRYATWSGPPPAQIDGFPNLPPALSASSLRLAITAFASPQPILLTFSNPSSHALIRAPFLRGLPGGEQDIKPSVVGA